MKRSLLIALAACACASTPEASTVAKPFEITDGRGAAPFATVETATLTNYTRVAPNIGTAGKPGPGGIAAAKAAGFRTIIDLRGPDEDGVAGDAAAAVEMGMDRATMPMPGDAEAIPAFIDELADLLDDQDRYPILLHCGSANRAGAAWALYRAENGVPALIAIEEGRAAGMTSRESLVREVLGAER